MIVILAILHSKNYLKIHEASAIKSVSYLTQPIEVKFAISPTTLEEKLNKHKGENVMLITNFPPDSHFPEDEYKERRTRGGDCLSIPDKKDTFLRSHRYFTRLFSKYTFEAVHFVTGAPEGRLEEEYLKGLIPDTEISVTRHSRWTGIGPYYNKPFIESLTGSIWNAASNISTRKSEKVEKYLDIHVFYGLNDLNTGFDVDSIKYFSEKEFEIILGRVKKLGLGIHGIEPWKNGSYYDVETVEEYQTESTDSNWYMKSFQKFKERGEILQYAASYYIPESLLEN